MERYGDVPPEQAELIVALGGDGFMLRTLHAWRELEVPVYGMKLGRVGFLMNKYKLDQPARAHRPGTAWLRCSRCRCRSPMVPATSTTRWHSTRCRCCVRATRPHLEVQLNETGKLANLICDGIMVATPASSTAYNLSAHGPILPLDANVLALTDQPVPASPLARAIPAAPHGGDAARARSRQATGQHHRHFHEVRDVRTVSIRQSGGQGVRLLFDPEHNLEQRILDEQFAAR